ncbi:MAG: helix-turn-helix domain-containing protein [Lewinella sp.]
MYAYKTPAASTSISPLTLSVRVSRSANSAVVRQLIARKPAPQDPNQAFLAAINAEIERQIDNADLGIRELMAAVHLSHSQLFRRIKAVTNMNPTAYIRTIRLQKANQLLISTNWQVAEIAYSLGFTDPNYFSRAFRKAYGCSPMTARREGTN